MDRTGEIEKPQIVVVIRELPSGNARKEGVHNDELLDFCGELCGIRVRNHQSDVVADNPGLRDAEGFREGMNPNNGCLHVGAAFWNVRITDSG